MMRGLLVAFMGVSLALNGVRAEDPAENLTPFTKDSTLLLNVHKSNTNVKEYVKHGAKFLHAKVMGEDMKHEDVQKMFADIAATKRKEYPWWNVWSYPTPVTVVLEQSEYSMEQFDAITCKVVAEWMHKEVLAASQAHPWWMFGRWNDTKSAWGVINVQMGGQMPKECVEDIMAQGTGNQLWYVGVAPQINAGEEIDMSKDVMKKVNLMSLPYPAEQPVRGQLKNTIEKLPKDVKLMITHMPTDKAALAHARHLLELMNTLHPNKLVLTIDASVPAPVPEPSPKPADGDDVPSEEPKPVTPTEQPVSPSEEPKPVDPSPTPVDPSPKPVDPKKEEDEDVPAPPKPEPKPEDKKDDKKKEEKGLEVVQIIAWILIVALVCAAGWWFTVGNKEEQKKVGEMGAGLMANEAPSAATGVAARGDNKV